MNQIGQQTLDFPFLKNICNILFNQPLDKESKPHYTWDSYQGFYYAPGKPRHQLSSAFAQVTQKYWVFSDH